MTTERMDTERMNTERAALRGTVTEFVRREIAPNLQAWEDAGEIPRELHVRAAEQGLLGIGFPEHVGGEGGTSPTRSPCRRPSSRPVPPAG